MRLNFVSWTVHDINTAAVALPSGNSRWEVLVGVRNAPVVFFLVLVLFGVGRGIAALPECFDKVVALLVVRELFKRSSFFVGDDPDDILVEPFLVSLAEFDLQRSFLLFFLLLVGRALEGIDLIAGLRLGASHRCTGLSVTGSSGFVALGPGRGGQACSNQHKHKR